VKNAIFGSQILTDRVRYSHGLILAEVRDEKSIFPEFLPIQLEIVESIGLRPRE